ncbi:MAG: Lrp/AsnC family transcriptional regulator [Staphylothermus sp.]|nr:Lrp/AsnC family transcriptional regulator [Staphylothermus sp.]
MPRKISELDRKIYYYVLERGEQGIPQNVLWKELGITSRDASRSLKKLEELGLVKREPIVYGGRKTFRVIAIPGALKEYESKEKKEEIIERPLIEIKKFIDIPCMYCPYIDACYEGGYYDPRICDWLSKWIVDNVYGRRRVRRKR